MINLGLQLGVKANRDLISFVAGRLLKHAQKDLAHSIRQSFNFAALVGGQRHLRAQSDADLVELLVEQKVHALY